MKAALSSVITFLLALVSLASQAQAPNWQAAAGILAAQTTLCDAEVTATATDASGNVYLVGTYLGPVSFGPIQVNKIGSSYLFVAKWSSAAKQFVWVQRAGGDSFDNTATAVAVSGNNVYIAGHYTGNLYLGTIPLPNAGPTSTSGPRSTDAFVAKLTDLGSSAEFTWAQKLGDSGHEVIKDLAVNGTNIYIAGSFDSYSITLGATTLLRNGAATGPGRSQPTDIFVAKLTDAGSTGSFVWAQRAGGTDYDAVSNLSVNGTSVYLTVALNSAQPTFGSVPLPGNSPYVVKLTDAGSSGSFIWAQPFTGASARALASYGSAVYLAGSASDLVRFGPLSMTLGSNIDAFVAKLTDAGSTATFTWVQTAGGPDYEFGQAITANATGVYLAGSFRGRTATFGSTTLTNADASGNTSDIFVTQLIDAGSTAAFGWATQAGGPFTDECKALAANGATLYAAGYASGTVSFGNQVLTSITGTSSGFLGVLAASPLATSRLAWPEPVTAYPNPARGTTTIRIPAIAGATHATVTLSDGLGRTLYTRQTLLTGRGATVAVPLQQLAAGLYQVRVQAGQHGTNLTLAVE